MNQIKMILIIYYLISFPINSFPQVRRECKSKEEDIYFDSLRSSFKGERFEPVPIETVKNNIYDYVKIIEVENSASTNLQQGISQFWDSTLYQVTDMNDIAKFDSVMMAIRNHKIGIIPKMSIIKQEKLGAKWAIIYSDSKYDDFIYGGWGYWLALSNDNGITWNKYYTGLTENFYYFLKSNSRIPLWKDSATLQVEAAIVRQISQVIHPLPAEFEIVQDGIAVQLNISNIIQDSDNDGLNDISENKMLLNPYNSDTDGDGIKDSEDKNPRFKSVTTEKSIIYETLIENFRPNKMGEMEINLANPLTFKKSQLDSLYGDFETVNLFVTDDKELQGLNLQSETIIIMSTKEYNDYKKKYPSHFIKSDYSKMFRCNLDKDLYKIHTSHLTSSWTYYVRKTKTGWKISMLSMVIS